MDAGVEPVAEAKLAAEAHRLANTLQIVLALLAHRRRRLVSAEALEQLEWMERTLRTLIRAGSPDGADWFSSQLDGWQELCAESGIELRYEVDSSAVPGRQGTTLALVAEELVTNAVKHAFVGRVDRRITVCLRRDGQEMGELVVADNGIGLRGARGDGDLTNAGMQRGSALLSDLADSMGATLELRDADGVTATVRFPIG